jgi:hypothetical protein
MSDSPWKAFDFNWFRKHQGKLLWAINGTLSTFVKDLFCINTDNLIVGIYPNHYTTLSTGERTSRFHCHYKYSKRVYYAFKPIWWAMHYWDSIFADRLIPELSFGFSTLTAYPAASSGGASCDGQLAATSTSATWATLHDATDADDVLLEDTEIYCGCRTHASFTNRYLYIRRSGFSFDTSSLTAAATISAASLGLYGYVKASQGPWPTASDDFKVVSFAPADPDTYVAGDFDAFGTEVFGSDSYSGFDTSDYNVYVLAEAARATISLTGVTSFGIRFDGDVRDSAPSPFTNGQWIYYGIASADSTGTSTDPYLETTYTIPNPGRGGAILV